MSKPDWKNAPEWAEWLAMDSNGEWYFYEELPIALHNGWVPNYSSSECVLASEPVSSAWRITLERRPI